MSTIEWTDRTWNPTIGCSRVSPGCDHCYAESFAARGLQEAHAAATADGRWTGDVLTLPHRLDAPLRLKKPQRIFVDSMSDLFHDDVPEPFIRQVWDVMARADHHTFQVLTKRSKRMAALCRDRDATPDEVDAGCELGIVPGLQYDSPLRNVWLGVSVENQRYADLRIPHLLATPAAVRFLSIEPLLGPVDLDHVYPGTVHSTDWLAELDWVIVGGESGHGARPMHPDWVRSLRDQCVAAGVAFFFKQWGEYRPLAGNECAQTGDVWPEGTQGAMCRRVGKKAAGRELDGRTWDEFPR